MKNEINLSSFKGKITSILADIRRVIKIMNYKID